MVCYLARTNCRSWVKRQFAAPTIRGILGVELPSPNMTVPVTDLPITRRNLTSSSGSMTGCCAAQSNGSFLGSRLLCQMRRAARAVSFSAKGLPITKHVGRGGYMRFTDPSPQSRFSVGREPSAGNSR